MNMEMLSAMQRSLLKKVKTLEMKQEHFIFTMNTLLMHFFSSSFSFFALHFSQCAEESPGRYDIKPKDFFFYN